MLAAFPVLALTWGVLLSSGAEPPGLASSALLPPVRRLDVSSENVVPAPEIRIAPGRSTTLFFDARIRTDDVVLEGRERFQRVGLADDHLALVPSSTLRPGARLRLGVRFLDGAAPEQLVFWLVVDPTRAEPQVEVFRRVRTAESYRREVDELRARLAQARSELERLHSTGRSSGSLEEVVATLGRSAGLLHVRGLEFAHHPGSDLHALKLQHVALAAQWSALLVTLHAPPGGVGWVASGGSLTRASGQVLELKPPWQSTPVISEETQTQEVVVLLADESALTPGRYTLKLWDARGRTLTVERLEVK
ncbi:DUF2381 family protein [Myxococcus sp. K38C18041901]|uniref:DUF2381 family protein n=1 Tax=Myxococcus guangdongensis TaxID=2906760 RepID=UPI0020A7A9E8|nr:DUF2381 family protein [Myxococcus guangdongensis]MCP3060489.1 DUF2381 family protein [Myxococcus guangdongensis]